MNLRKLLPWIIFSLFPLGCARQTSPTGGPKDTIPPNLLHSNPTKGQTNFQSNSIELTFDETIILNNPKEQIIITPNIGKDFEVTAKKDRAVLKFTTELLDTTTYSVNFREAVQDVTEKNPALGLKLAFSTGSFIDSLSFDGTIVDPLTSKEIKDATVALYQSDTFNIFKHRPSYFSKTDEKGKFLIENLKPGNYKIYTFEDKNKNLIVDSKSESYGFLSQTQTLTTNIQQLSIPTIHLDARPLILTSARPSGNHFNIKTAKNIKSYTLKVKGLNVYSSYAEDKSNIRVYNNIQAYDSIPMQFFAQDSVDNKIDTVIYLKFTKRDIKPEPFKTTASTFRLIAAKGILTGKLNFTKPIQTINYDSIFFQIDSLTIIPITQNDIAIDSTNNIVTIHKTIDKTLLIKKPPLKKTAHTTSPSIDKQQRPDGKKPNITTESQVQNQLYIAHGTFISIEQDSSARLTQNIQPSTLESTGVIHANIKTQQSNFIVQLLTKDHNEIQSVINDHNPTFEDLVPGDYQLRLIIDQDKNQAWSPGNYDKKQEPEPIKFYRNEQGNLNINLKANWELGPLLITF